MKRLKQVTMHSTALLLLVTQLSVEAAGAQADEATPPTTAATVLIYNEEEPGTGSYPVRYLITADSLRIDDGHDASDYVLVDRRSGIINSVSHEHGNILVIRRQASPQPPASLALRLEAVPDSAAPGIGGRQPEHYRYLANDELCYEAVTLPGLLPDAVSALVEYEQLLAGQQAASLESTPVEFRTPCFLSRYIYTPARHLEQGLPVEVWDAAGYRRMLVDYSEAVSVPQHLFTLPPEYTEFALGGPSDADTD